MAMLLLMLLKTVIRDSEEDRSNEWILGCIWHERWRKEEMKRAWLRVGNALSIKVRCSRK